MADYSLNAKERTEKGTPASRRLRRKGWIPANVYGSGKEPRMVALSENELMQLMEDEGFLSGLIRIDGLNERQEVLVRDIQMHPFKPKPLHVDFQRVKADQKLSLEVPLHVSGEEEAPGLLEGGTLSYLMTEVKISCLPKNIPDYLEADVRALGIGDTLHLSDIPAPAGVEIVFDEESDHAVVTIAGVQPAPEVAEAEEAAVAEGSAEGEEPSQSAEGEGE